MDPDQEIRDMAQRLRSAADDAARLRILRRAVEQFSPDQADEYEYMATAITVARTDTAEFARRVLQAGDLDDQTRLLVFTIGVIAYRRAQNKHGGDELFRLVGDDFAELPLFKHLFALSLDGGKRQELRRGLRLEREVVPEMAPHAGGAHLIARFILQLRECDDTEIGEKELHEALDAVNEAVELRPNYAKFFATRASVYRMLGRFNEARSDLLDAIRLEDRRSFDAQERIGDYKQGLLAIEVYRDLGSVNAKVAALEGRTQRTIERLRAAEISVISAVAFIAGILSLIQITLVNITGRPLGESLVIVAFFAGIIFAAVGLGAWLLRQPWKRLAEPEARSDDFD